MKEQGMYGATDDNKSAKVASGYLALVYLFNFSLLWL